MRILKAASLGDSLGPHETNSIALCTAPLVCEERLRGHGTMLLTVSDHRAFDSFHILGHLSLQSQEGKGPCAYATIKDTRA